MDSDCKSKVQTNDSLSIICCTLKLHYAFSGQKKKKLEKRLLNHKGLLIDDGLFWSKYKGGELKGWSEQVQGDVGSNLISACLHTQLWGHVLLASMEKDSSTDVLWGVKAAMIVDISVWEGERIGETINSANLIVVVACVFLAHLYTRTHFSAYP